MSWSFPPRGLAVAEFAERDDSAPYPLSAVVYDCPDFYGGTVECHRADHFENVVTLFVAATLGDLAGSYPWYHVTVQFIFPPLPTGTRGCQSFGIYSGCSSTNIEGGNSDGALLHGLALVDGVGNSLPTTNGTRPGVLEQWKIGDISYGYVVNPAPTYPVPDTYGNTSGVILWEAADLAALVVQFSWRADIGYATPLVTPGPIQWGVSVAGYNEVTPTNPTVAFVTDPTGTD